MPRTCCVFGCLNRSEKHTGISFHKFPEDRPEIYKKWLVKISRDDFEPSKHHSVCSDHFTKEDYMRGIHPRNDTEVVKHQLLANAVPTLFPSHPVHKQSAVKKRKAPRKRPFSEVSNVDAASDKPEQISKKVCVDIGVEHSYVIPADAIEDKLKDTEKRLIMKTKELKLMKQKVKRRDERISNLLKSLKENELISSAQYDLLNINFNEKTKQLIENELKAVDTNKHGLRYSDEVKEFAVTLHFYSAQAYDFLRKYLHLPCPATIRKWSVSLNCEPGFLFEVLEHIKKEMISKPHMKDCILMFDAMAIKKEVVYDPKFGTYSGFVNCGRFLASSEDSVATEALVFMVVGLNGHWKFPVAYFLTGHLSGEVQAEILRLLIPALEESGLIIHGITCDGSYANQLTARKLGCSLDPENLMHKFPNPTNANQFISFIFDACHLVKLVRNSLATQEIYYNNNLISWKYIEKLHEIQQKDNLTIANKLKAQHILWKQHKMKVKYAVQTLSTSVADAIDFLREDLKLEDFANSEHTTEFIRKFDKLFDFMNSKIPHGKGFKSPVNLKNFNYRKQQLEEIKDYIRLLKDSKGQPLCTGRRKTGFVGFLMTIDSVMDISWNLLSRATDCFKYVLTFKMSQDHLEMFFSRVRRRGGWNNNPNCLQFKWALRSMLLKNSILPSNNGNVSVEEPSENLFDHEGIDESSEIHHTNEKMKKFAQILSQPSEYHEHVIHYMSGYIVRKLITLCKCETCCNTLRKTSSEDLISNNLDSLTNRKNRGGLINPRNDIFRIVQTTDTILRYLA